MDMCRHYLFVDVCVKNNLFIKESTFSNKTVEVEPSVIKNTKVCNGVKKYNLNIS